jgi:hypothetical protein
MNPMEQYFIEYIFCAVFGTIHTCICNVPIPYATFHIKICEFFKLAFH